MAFSQTDVEAIEQAMLDQASGKRVSSVTIDGNTTAFEGGASLNQLKTLYELVKSQVASSSFVPRSHAKSGRRR